MTHAWPLTTATLLLAVPLATEPPPRTTPPPSAGHALVYHDSLGAILLVNAGLGDQATPPVDARTVVWRWSGETWSVLDSSGPPVRNLGGVAYDSRRNVLVLFGGTYSQDLSYGDTWEWRPDTGWQEKQAPGPGRRDHTQMAYDPGLGRVVLFGGQASPDSFPADTWTWDGAVWRLDATAGPPRRVHHTMAYDRSSRRVVLFGGVNPGGSRLGDTWAWSADGGWTRAADDIRPRSHAAVAANANGLILLGGLDNLAGVLRLADGAWRQDSLGGPGARYLPAVAYDPVRRVTVVFGGGNREGLLGDTWEFDGAQWRRR